MGYSGAVLRADSGTFSINESGGVRATQGLPVSMRVQMGFLRMRSLWAEILTKAKSMGSLKRVRIVKGIFMNGPFFLQDRGRALRWDGRDENRIDIDFSLLENM